MTDVFGISVDRIITSADDLKDISKPASSLAANKAIDHIDDLARRFIAAAPLAIVSTAQPGGMIDVTPRGDPAGFVHVLNKNLLALPDRPGNRRMDSFHNLFENPNVGILFIIPGRRDTLRVAGKGAVVQDKALSERLAVNGRPAGLVQLVKVEHVMCHCTKAFIRGKIWQPEDWPDITDVPSMAEIAIAHTGITADVATVDADLEENARTTLY